MERGRHHEPLSTLLFRLPMFLACPGVRYRVHSVVRGTIPRTQNTATRAKQITARDQPPPGNGWRLSRAVVVRFLTITESKHDDYSN